MSVEGGHNTWYLHQLDTLGIQGIFIEPFFKTCDNDPMKIAAVILANNYGYVTDHKIQRAIVNQMNGQPHGLDVNDLAHKIQNKFPDCPKIVPDSRPAGNIIKKVPSSDPKND